MVFEITKTVERREPRRALLSVLILPVSKNRVTRLDVSPSALWLRGSQVGFRSLRDSRSIPAEQWFAGFDCLPGSSPNLQEYCPARPVDAALRDLTRRPRTSIYP